jgi:chromosome segregation ATPase
MSDRDAYIKKIKANIDQWNADIDKLQARAKEVEADARIKYDEQIAELKQQRDQAETKMKEARAASEEAWADLRAGFESAWDSVSKAFSTAMKRFNK